MVHLKKENLFPDYEPKRTLDTLYDYLRDPKTEIFDILSRIGEPTCDKIANIISLYKTHEKSAKKKPGSVQKGNVAIGADVDQYYPSEEELLISELGKMIKSILLSCPKEKIAEIKRKQGIKSQKIEYNEIFFRHVDVMGSGRYFYAEKIAPKIKLEL
ncbi:MAG: hypothetical protein ACFE8J_18815 [Candidatus Heimdallarchaeota archaeon]